jgi:ribosomal protein S27E
MSDLKCPGQDTRFWKKGDVFDVPCPGCGREVEFFKDDVRRRCRCGRTIVNPKLDLACAEWCQHAEKCLGELPESPLAAKRKRGARTSRSSSQK